MKCRYRIAVFFGLLLFLGAATSLATSAQVRGGWSEPQQLSTPKNKASEASLVSDQYGFVHIFWSEIVGETRSILQYTRFDGETWSAPIDLRISGAQNPIQSLSSFVDGHGTLHLIWTTSQAGPFYYSTAPAHDALASGKWSDPRRVDVEASKADLAVDANGTIHILAVNSSSTGRLDPGVYYLNSQDEGLTWTEQRWLDPDILADHYPSGMQFAMDEDSGLHAVWYYISQSGDGADWIRYTHSLDSGESWSRPFTIAKNEVGSVGINSSASPVIAVQGHTVHVIWAGSDLKRRHRYSTDAGKMWSPAARFFGDLEGQAFEGLTVDGNGRVHYFAQLRPPQAIYHGYWDGEKWSRPELIFFISAGTSDPIDETDIHAHHTLPAMRAGNEIVLTFADSPPEPERRLFMIHRTLEDVAPVSLQPTPTAVAQPEATPTAALLSSSEQDMITAPVPESEAGAKSIDPKPGTPVFVAVIPVLILIGATAAFQLFRKRRS